MRATRELRDNDARVKALASLVPYLAEFGHIQEVLAVAREIEQDWYRENALTELIPYLAKLGHLQEALTLIQEIGTELLRAKALARLAPHLPEAERMDILRKALVTALKIKNESFRTEVLIALVPLLAQVHLHPLYLLWRETLPISASRTRQDLLADLQALIPVIIALGGVEAVAETFHAIRDVCRWWP